MVARGKIVFSKTSGGLLVKIDRPHTYYDWGVVILPSGFTPEVGRAYDCNIGDATEYTTITVNGEEYHFAFAALFPNMPP